jgi:hypothetical protein
MNKRVCDCENCSDRIGISPACMRNSLLIGGALWVVLIAALWCALKIFN